MSGGKSRAVSAKGVQEFRPYVTKVLPLGARVTCADNTGAKILEIIIIVINFSKKINDEFKFCLKKV